MTHEFETGFFVKTPAWHRLGTLVKEAPTASEAIKLAGLDWEVETLPVVATRSDDNGVDAIPCDDWRAWTRNTDKRVLSIQGKGAVPLQNREAFDFVSPIVQDGDGTFETAGALREGRTVWVLVKLTGQSNGGDPLAPYLLVSNSHDASQAVRVTFVVVRVVCANTLEMALAEGRAQNGVSIRHTAGMQEALKRVQDCIDVGRRSFTVTLDQFEAMRAKGVDSTTLRKYVTHVVKSDRQVQDLDAMLRAAEAAQDFVKADEIARRIAREPNAVDEIIRGFETWAGQKEAGHTVYGALNAITYWTAHERGRTDATRLHANWFGEGRAIRRKAHDAALALLK